MAIDEFEKLSRDEELYQEAFSREMSLAAYNLEKRALLEEGMQKGIEQGKLENQREIVLNMLGQNLEISIISKVTGLSEQEINTLKQK